MRSSWSRWLVIGLAATVFAAGCGDDDESGDAAATDGGGSDFVTQAQAVTEEAAQVPTEILQTEAVSPPKDVFVYHVGCDQSLEGCADKTKSLEAASKAIGWEFEMCDGGATPDRIAQCFTNAVNAKPDIIITNGIGVAEAGDSYAEVEKAGIPHIGMFTGNDPGSAPGVATEVGGDACGSGAEELANWVVADSGGEANVLFIGTDTFKCNQQRLAGFESVISQCESCEFATLKFSIDSIQSTLPQQIQAELQSRPDLDYVVGTFDAVALVATDAIRQAGRAEEIKVGGFDGNGPNLELIRAGDIQFADVATGRHEPGWVAIDAAARLLAGEQLDPVTQVTNVLITPDNVGQIGDSYGGAEGFEDQFRSLWGL